MMIIPAMVEERERGKTQTMYINAHAPTATVRRL